MSDDYHHLPILPASGSLASHIQALDLLATRLSSLSTRSEWETRIPLNSKASVMGRIVETGNVKINIGGEWWVDMTPQEGEAWVRRRKAGKLPWPPNASSGRTADMELALLEEHAKVLEGWRPGQGSSETTPTPKQSQTVPEPRFDTIFRSPVQATTTPTPVPAVKADPTPNSKSSSAPAVLSASSAKSTPNAKSANAARSPVPAPVPGPTPGPAAAHASAPTSASASKTKATAKTGTSQPNPSNAAPTIQDILNSFMENQESLAKGTGKAGMPNGTPTDVVSHLYRVWEIYRLEADLGR